MRGQVQTLPIDSKKFKEQLKKRNLTMAEASREIGMSNSYLQRSVKEKCIQVIAINALENKFQLKYEDYKPEKQADEIENVRFLTLDQVMQEVSEIPKPDFETSILQKIEGLGNGQNSISVDTTIIWHLLQESLDVFKNMNQVLARMDKGQRVQIEQFNKMNDSLKSMNESLESIHKKLIGLEEVVYKGTKRALNE